MFMIPKRNHDLWDDIFDDPFFREPAPFMRHEPSHIMKTDVKELKDKFEISIDFRFEQFLKPPEFILEILPSIINLPFNALLALLVLVFIPPFETTIIPSFTKSFHVLINS